MSFFMSDILTTIRDLAVNELEDLDESESVQNDAIYRFVNIVMRKRAKQANNVQWSDALSIASNGYQTFLVSAVAISNMFQPLMVWDMTAREKQTRQRNSFDGGNGWYREADNQLIHTYGLTGSHKLQFIRYPATITASSDTVEMPLSGQWDVVFDVAKLIKYPKNFYNEADAMGKQATGIATVKASIAAQGKGNPNPDLNDKEV